MTHLTVLDGEHDAANDTNCPDERAFPTLVDDARIALKAAILPHASGTPQALRDSMALAMLRNWIADLQNVILNADLTQRAEFHALMSAMIGLGLTQSDLADALCVDANTVSRYATGGSCPANPVNRRGTLLETYRLVQRRLGDGTLGTTRHFATEYSATG